MNAADFIKVYEGAAERFGDSSPMLVHFRIATQGKVNKDNCHPFQIKGGALIHNGSFWNEGGRDAAKSDTAEFSSIFHNILAHEDMEKAKYHLGRAIGAWNKVAVLYDTKEVVILNKDGWSQREDGILFSHAGHNSYKAYGERQALQ